MRALLLLALLAGAHAQNAAPLRVRRVARLRRPINGGPAFADAEVANGVPDAAAVLAPLTAETAAAALQSAAAEGPAPEEAAAAEAPESTKALSDAPPTKFVRGKAGSTHKAKEFIVLFNPEVEKPGEMAMSMQASLASKLPVPTGPDGAPAPGPFVPFTVLDASRAQPADDGYVFPVKIATIRVANGVPDEAVIAGLMAEPGVQSVHPNTIYSIAQACTAPASLSGFAPSSHGLKWDGCLTSGRSLVWYGARCGDASDQIQWDGIFVADSNGKPITGCHVAAGTGSYKPGTSLYAAVFGACGVAPSRAQSLPTRVCGVTSPCIQASQLGKYSHPVAVSGCGATSNNVVYSGSKCGDGGKYIKWTTFWVPNNGNLACKQTPAGASNPMFDREWFGDCGVPPATFKALPVAVCGAAPPPGPTPPPPGPSPPPPPPAGGLPREALASGERDLKGMTRIQAAVNSKVPALPDNSPVVVAVLDTGGTNLADLNVKNGISFVGGSLGGDWTDRQKHGTHVAGTISGQNNGGGVYGALPGVRVLPVKVLGDNGYGDLSDIMAAIDYVATNAKTLGVNVINMSLGGGGSASDPICQSIKAATDRGIIVVVAAGNDGRDLRNYSPASCAAAVTVTAIDASSDSPASFSNWAPASGSDAALLRRTVAAPGVDVVSTLPDGSYASFSGTSMATPHAVGVAARCFAAGECNSNAGAQNRERFLDAVWAKYNADSGYRWNDGSSPVVSGKFYGPLVWADKW